MSSGSREYSPDWLRSTDPTTTTEATSILFTLSSSDDDDDLLPIRSVINTKPLTTKKEEQDDDDVISLPSDSDHDHYSDKQQDDDDVSSQKTTVKLEDSPNKRRRKSQDTKKEIDDHPNPLQTESKPQTGPYISSSTLPLLLPDKIQRTKALVECEGESIDLSGDLGVVGRVVISDSPSGDQDMFLDLKGTIYKTTIIPSRTFCVVSFGQSEAKIEAIMNDFIQLKPQSNVYEAETMVEGTLEGFSFESEDEADKQTIRQADENEGGEPQTNGKGRRKAEKTSDASKKKGKAAVKKPAKKVKRKAPVAKKTKTKK
ncbi:DNA-binding protein BIN4 [Tanacetum coccineum]